ncbi:lipase [Mycena galericulata]|nr:lipase [Mycena galericulata]
MKAVVLSSLFLSLSFASPAPLSSSSQEALTFDPIFPLAISPSLYDDFVRYTKYSSAAYKYSHEIYQRLCPRPLGNTLVHAFERGRTQGFIARDDDRKEIVVSFRGTFDLTDAITDIKFTKVKFEVPGLSEIIRVHRGFMAAHEDVAADALSTVKNVLKNPKYTEYTIVVTGHSLGGAIACIAATILKGELLKGGRPDTLVKLYTFGQPRVGEAKFAKYVEKVLGEDNIFRVVHTRDLVPHVPKINYEHFGTEYWQFKDPWLSAKHPEKTVTKCDGGEDPNCSRSNWPRHRVTPFHQVYFGYVMSVTPLLCV